MKQKGMKYNDTPMLISPNLWNQIQRYIRPLDVLFCKLCKNCKELDFEEIRYYRINQILLSIIQLWPYRKKSTLSNITGIFIFILLMSITFFQLTTFLTFKYTTDLFVSIMSYSLIALTTAFTYYYFYNNLNKIEKMLRDIYEIWKDLEDEKERHIMRWYSCLGELFTILVTFFCITGLGMYTCILFSPLILDIILPLNEARPVLVYALTEYFIDSQKYYYLILCHWLVTVYFGCFIFAAIISIVVAYIQHICGSLNIASYRIGQAIDESTKLSSLTKKDCNSIWKLRAAVDIHRSTLKRADVFLSSIKSFSIFLIVMLFSSLCLNSFRLLRAIALKNVSDIIPAFLVCGAHFVVLFFTNYYGQKVTDHDSNILKKVYDVRWYETSTDVQKLLLFIMKKTTKTYAFNIGNVLVASMETFNNISQTCMSYFAIIYSLMEW